MKINGTSHPCLHTVFAGAYVPDFPGDVPAPEAWDVPEPDKWELALHNWVLEPGTMADFSGNQNLALASFHGIEFFADPTLQEILEFVQSPIGP